MLFCDVKGQGLVEFPCFIKAQDPCAGLGEAVICIPGLAQELRILLAAVRVHCVQMLQKLFFGQGDPRIVIVIISQQRHGSKMALGRDQIFHATSPIQVVLQTR